MGDDTCSGGTEHFISVNSLQRYNGGFGPQALKEDGTFEETSRDLSFVEETGLSMKCVCGKQFDNYAEAEQHIRNVQPDTDQLEGGSK